MISSSLSILVLTALFAGSNAQCSTGCIGTLTDAQGCLRECVNKDPVPEWGGKFSFATNGASRLWQCLPGNGKTEQFDEDKLTDLVQCCEMNTTCQQTFADAKTCASQNGDDGGRCIHPCLRNRSNAYMNCLIRKADSNACQFAGLCVGQLTGNDSFEFASTLAEDADGVTSDSCASMDGFVDGLCGISDRCCDDCNAQMGNLAGCIVNNLLLPESSTAGSVTCPVSTPNNGPCGIGGASAVAVARGGGRKLQDDDEDMEVELEGDVDLSDCEEALSLDFIVHNETFAAEQYIQCLGKKVGQVLSEADNVSSTVGDSAANSATIMLFGTVMAVSSLWSLLM